MNSIPLQNNSNLVNNNVDIQQNPNSITIGTQTDNSSNIGKGTETLDPNRVINPFDNSQPGSNPLQLTNRHKVMNVHFIAEAIELDNQSSRIRKLINNKGWPALKHFSEYWFTLQKDLSVNESGCILYNGILYLTPHLRDIALHSIHKAHTG